MKKFSNDDVERWIADNIEMLKRTLKETDSIPEVIKSIPRIIVLWNVGCWLDYALESIGADEQTRHDVCFAFGQSSFIGEPFSLALDYADEFAEKGEVADKPGEELAERIFKKQIGA